MCFFFLPVFIRLAVLSSSAVRAPSQPHAGRTDIFIRDMYIADIYIAVSFGSGRAGVAQGSISQTRADGWARRSCATLY